MKKSNVEEETSAVKLFRSSRGQYLMSKALYYGVQEINERPEHKKEWSNMDDMKYIYKKIFPIFKNVDFTLEKGGEEDSFKTAFEFASNMRGLYIQAQALSLAIQYLNAKKDKTETMDIQDMAILLNGFQNGFDFTKN